MTDLGESLATRVCALLEAQRTAIGRHAHLLDAQRAALRADDLELVADLSGQSAHLLQNLEEAGRHLVVIQGQLAGAEGPRASMVRSLLAAVTAEVHIAFAGVRQFTEALVHKRNRLLQGITELGGRGLGPPGRSFRDPPADPTILDRSG